MNSPQLAEAFPAGEILADELEARGWTQADFADVLGRPAQFVSEIVSGKKEITRESAAQIAAALGTTPEFWLNLQDSYLLWKHAEDPDSRKALDAVRTRARLRQLVPVPLLVKRGFLSSSPDTGTQAQEVIHLLGMQDLDGTPMLRFAARRSNSGEEVTILQRSWVACVRESAHSLPKIRYSPAAFESVARQLSVKARDPWEFASFQSLFAETGVKLVHIQSFPGSKLDGCAMLVDDVPVIGISGRGKRLDKVLFTILHEAAHVLLGHLEQDGVAIVDDLSEEGSGTESDADRLASKLAIQGTLPTVPARPTSVWVRREADRLNIHPITLIGRLQNEGSLSWRTSLAHGAPTVTDYLQTWEPVRE